MDYFAQLGALVERAWTDANRDETAFPLIAEEALGKLHPRDHFDLDAFLDVELDPTTTARRERAPLGAFGQPGVTLHFGREFAIELYYWVDSLSGVHDHPFAGLFVIVKGESVHTRYRFEERDRVGTRLRIGALVPEGIELLSAGEHRLFGDRTHPLIHTLLHVPVPSISMVIRTVRTRDYWRYVPPSLALLTEDPDAVIARQLAWLESLRGSNDPNYAERLARYLERSDLETGLLAIVNGWITADDATRDAQLTILRERHGHRVDAIEPALARMVQSQQAHSLRTKLLDPDDRLVATALAAGEGRAQVLEVIGRRHADPVARLHTFLDAYGAFIAGDEASVAAAHLLIDGGGRAAIEKHVGDIHGANVLEEQRGQIIRFCRESIFAALID
jgi:hypothetical protein